VVAVDELLEGGLVALPQRTDEFGVGLGQASTLTR
jgi:hypothetical protein